MNHRLALWRHHWVSSSKETTYRSTFSQIAKLFLFYYVLWNASATSSTMWFYRIGWLLWCENIDSWRHFDITRFHVFRLLKKFSVDVVLCGALCLQGLVILNICLRRLEAERRKLKTHQFRCAWAKFDYSKTCYIKFNIGTSIKF